MKVYNVFVVEVDEDEQYVSTNDKLFAEVALDGLLKKGHNAFIEEGIEE